MTERGLRVDFSPETEREAEALRPAAVQGLGRRDLTDLPFCSIDNDDSEDLDQLSWAERRGDGTIRVLVAVADVDTCVRRGSAIDDDAFRNTTSVYTAAEIFPMLPLRLSTDLTSLNPNEARAATITEFSVTEEGETRDESVYSAVVRNVAKLAYPSVGAWLEGTGPLPAAADAVPGMDDLLRLQDQASLALERRRYERGALEFDTHEPRVRFEHDRVAELVLSPKNRATRLIENFMVAANGVIARDLRAKGSPAIHRAVPTPERWEEIAELAALHEYHLPSEPDARALRSFLAVRRQEDPLRFPDLSLAVIKLLGRGLYVVEPPGGVGPGHFGLAVRDYTHSTAPNRRYPDLIAQRLVKAALSGDAAPYSMGELEEIAEQCSRQEEAADKVERRLRKSAAALLLRPRIGDHFDGVVSGASEKGTWVRVLDPPVEGKVVTGAKKLKVGRRIRVKLLRTHVAFGYLDFARV